MTKVQIKSDGTAPGTIIHINGERIENCGEVTWHLRPGGLAEVRIKLIDVELDVDGQCAMRFEGETVKSQVTRVIDALRAIDPEFVDRNLKMLGNANAGEACAAVIESLGERLKTQS